MTRYALEHTRPAPKKHAQAIGDDGEDAAAAIHDLPVFKERWHLVRRFARVQAGIYTECQGPDFSGWNRKSSRHVEVEVKTVADGRLPFERFRPSQVSTLRACAHDGGVAVVLILLGDHPQRIAWCAVPWSEIDGPCAAWAQWTEEQERKGRSIEPETTVDRARASLSETVALAWRAEPHRYLARWEAA